MRTAGRIFVPYFPLACGMLTGKYRRGVAPSAGRIAETGHRFPDIYSDECFAVVEALDAYAVAHGHALYELALSWLACQPGVASVIAGATSPEQVRANARSLGAWPLTKQQLEDIDALTFCDRSFTVPVELQG
jgi:aryl-alcohol dehydrogenase-like predicted oxidoreductase